MLRLCSAGLVAIALLGSTASTASELRLQSLSGETVDPFAAPSSTKAIAFVFVSVDCPISNRYAPALERLRDRFASQGVSLRLVYPNAAERVEAIRQHLSAYGHRAPALRDPGHELVKLARATVTPEAVVYDRSRRLVYRGRIDDRYVSVGVERPQPTRHDLADALAAFLEGQPVQQAAAPAVGCFIADLVQ